MRDSILDVMSHGGGAMWLILAFSIIAVGVAVERIIAQFQFTTRARALADTVGRCLSRGAASEGRSACERDRHRFQMSLAVPRRSNPFPVAAAIAHAAACRSKRKLH